MLLIRKLWDKFSFVSYVLYTSLGLIRDIMYMKRERELIIHCCCPGYVWFTASWTNCKQSTYCSFLYLSSHVKHIILIIDSCVQELVLIMRMSYMLFIFKVIAVYFKTICNSIFHKPTLSIPVSLPHSLFHSLFSLSLSLTRFLQAANHRIHCNTCNYFLTINCYLATGPLEKKRER